MSFVCIVNKKKGNLPVRQLGMVDGTAGNLLFENNNP